MKMLAIEESNGKPGVRRRADALLVCCSRARPDDETAARMRSLVKEGVDWNYLLRTAAQHGVQPLLYRHLAQVCPDLVPEATMKRLALLYRGNSARNHLLTGELLNVLRLFESQGIPAIPFKGPLLAMELYGDLAMRRCDDLDILVRRQDVLAADKLLRSRGYIPDLNLSDEAKAICLDVHDGYRYRRENPPVIVDMHWQILPKSHSIPFDISPLWENAANSDPTGVTVPAPKPETLLLMLCIHGYSHRWQRLCWLCDISELAQRKTELDWRAVLQQAADSRCLRIVLLGLHLARRLLGTPVPGDIIVEQRRDRSVEKLSMQIAGDLFRKRSSGDRFVTTAVFRVMARENVMDKVRYCYRSLLGTTVLDYLHLPLPDFLFFLYPWLRPFRLAVKYGAGVWGKG